LRNRYTRVGLTFRARGTIARMQRKELAHRQSDGLEISLLWDPRDDALAVRVVDARLGVTLELPVRDESPLEVFYHPFAVASRRGEPVAA
jgi:hypothetical protein